MVSRLTVTPPSQPQPLDTLRGSLYMVGTAIMFASAFVATRYTVGAAPPLLAAALRFTVAAAALAAFLGAQRRGCRPGGSPNARPRGRSADGREGDSGRLAAMAPGDRARIVVLGVLGVFAYHALFFWALQFTPASLSALIVPTTLPLATALMARAVLGERLGPYTLAGVAVATAGVALAAGPSADTASAGWLGPALLLVAVACFAAYSVLGYAPVARYGALRVTTYATVVGAALLWVAAVREWAALPHVPAGAWAAIAFMGVGSSGLGLVWNYRGGALLGPGRAAGFLYLVPLFAVTGSVLLLGESVYPRQLLGGGFIVLGVLLAQRRPGRKTLRFRGRKTATGRE